MHLNSTQWLLLLVALFAGLLALPVSAQEPGSSAASADSAMVGGAARVLPGDQIALRILREPEMSGVFNVAENGEVVFPRLGTVVVSGRSAGSLQEYLHTAYAEYLRNPTIEVTVLRRVGVQGEVRKPDVYMLDPTMTLRDVIAKAGGVTDIGNPRRIFVVRDGDRVRVGQGEMARLSAIELRSGDQIFVGQKSWLERNSLAVIGTVVGVIPTLLIIYDKVK